MLQPCPLPSQLLDQSQRQPNAERGEDASEEDQEANVVFLDAMRVILRQLDTSVLSRSRFSHRTVWARSTGYR